MTRLRISVVQYLNTVPLIWGMLRGRQLDKFELNFTTPASCADAVRSGAAAVGIIPSIETQRIPDLEAVHGISISSRGPVNSVLLISRKPIDQIQTVAADESSRTSVALTTVLLKKYYGLRPKLTAARPNLPAMLRDADAALLIGDPALTCQPAGMCVYDLAAEWNKFTRLPFVFALWAGRKSAGLAAHSQDFLGSRDYGIAHIDEIAAEHAASHTMTPAQVKDYLTRNIDYTLGEAHRQSLELFFELAREQDLIGPPRPLTFVGSGA